MYVGTLQIWAGSNIHMTGPDVYSHVPTSWPCNDISPFHSEMGKCQGVLTVNFNETELFLAYRCSARDLIIPINLPDLNQIWAHSEKDDYQQQSGLNLIRKGLVIKLGGVYIEEWMEGQCKRQKACPCQSQTIHRVRFIDIYIKKVTYKTIHIKPYGCWYAMAFSLDSMGCFSSESALYKMSVKIRWVSLKGLPSNTYNAMVLDQSNGFRNSFLISFRVA